MERDCEERLEAMIRWQKFLPMSFDSPWRRSLPHERKGTTVRVATIIRAFRALRQKHALVVVEGVGGVHVPITSSLNVLDLIYRLKLPAIVVGQSGLGGINHALLTLHALRRRKIPIVALVLNQRRPVHTKTARAQEQSTVSLLRRLAGVPVVGPLPYSPSVNRNWNEGLVRLAGTAPITKLARLVLARIIHEGSSRKRADAKRDGHSEARGLAPPSAAVPVPLLRRGQAPKEGHQSPAACRRAERRDCPSQPRIRA